jgi:ATP-binding cassette subfamily B protein
LDYVVLGHALPPQAAFLGQWFGQEPQALLLALVLGFICLRLVDTFFSYLHKVGILTAAATMLADIRERVFAHLQRLSLSFHESTTSGDLTYRITSDVGGIGGILIGLPQHIVQRCISVVLHVGVMVAVEWRLTLIACSVMPILFYVSRRMGSGVQSATETKRSKESEVSSIIVENIAAMALVQAYGREDVQLARFEAENRQSLESSITATRLTKTFKRIGDFLAALGTAGVVYYGGSLALDGSMLPGTLILFISYLRRLYRPTEQLSMLILQVARGQVAGKRLLELVESDMVMQDEPHAVPAPRFQGQVAFQQVSFAYQQGATVLKKISFVAEPGEMIAVVGHSGAGKSTLISLLLRFYDPQEGRILIDGRDVRDFTLKSLREQMTVVMQEAHLLHKTVHENIGFGNIDATGADVLRAATLAQAHDFIMAMPEGYAALIEEGGKNLSGGQKQRLNIARAIVRDTPILILDEPVTALDARSEAAVRRALEELTHGRTTFIVAHKFATIASADKILVLERGELVAYGTHTELLETSTAYRELYDLQFRPQAHYAAASPDVPDVPPVPLRRTS